MNTHRRLPSLTEMAIDLQATPAELASYWGVSKSTAYRWLSVGNAPRAAMLALYWLTRWGLSELDADTHNRANVFEGLAQALQRELWRQREDFTRLARIGHYGSANDPLPHVAPLLGLDDAGTLEARRPAKPRCDDHDARPPIVQADKR